MAEACLSKGQGRWNSINKTEPDSEKLRVATNGLKQIFIKEWGRGAMEHFYDILSVYKAPDCVVSNLNRNFLVFPENPSRKGL